MSRMLRTQATKHYGCCDHCARNVGQATLKPGPRMRHQARAREKARLLKALRRGDA